MVKKRKPGGSRRRKENKKIAKKNSFQKNGYTKAVAGHVRSFVGLDEKPEKGFL